MEFDPEQSQLMKRIIQDSYIVVVTFYLITESFANCKIQSLMFRFRRKIDDRFQ